MPRPTLSREFSLPFNVDITVKDGHALMTSGLHEQLVDSSPARDDAGLAASHAMESLLLALAAHDFDLGTPGASLALRDAVEAVAEYLCCI